MPDSLLRAAARGGSAVSAASQQRAQTLLDMKYPPPSQRDTSPPARRLDTSTNGVTQQSTFNYPAELPPLTAEQQAALMNRRRQATRAFAETEATINRQLQRAQAEALRAQGDIERQQQLQSRAGMQTLAGRGVARSPMFVNPFQRQLAEQSQRQVGQLQSGLADTLAQLEGALRQADIARERELAQIDFDAGSFRSDVARLLGG